ncbi:MAG: NAD-dependent epimerase/dehydratase family protein [bacterium]|nr:NAD-dependent epimerase/dehydratase family protein [bacterium]
MNLFVTGASGCIGSELLRRIRGRHALSVMLLEGDPASDRLRDEGAQVVTCDLGRPDADALEAGLEQVDTVVHLAGLVHTPDASPEAHRKINHEGTKTLIDAFLRAGAPRPKRFVFISTVSVFGNYKDGVYDEDDACRPDTPYGHYKLEAERELVRVALNNPALSYTILRPVTVFGANDRGNVGRMIAFMRRWRVFPLPGGGRNRKTLVHAADVAAAIDLVLDNARAENAVFVVGNEASPTLREIADSIRRNLDIRCALLPLPLGPLAAAPVARKLMRDNCYSSAALRTRLGFTPMTLDEGMRRLADPGS